MLYRDLDDVVAKLLGHDGDEAVHAFVHGEAAGHFGDDVARSVADIDSAEALVAVRQWKQANKAAKAAAER